MQQLGGKVHVPKTAVPGMGYFVICLDTENNAFGIWETNESASELSVDSQIKIGIY